MFYTRVHKLSICTYTADSNCPIIKQIELKLIHTPASARKRDDDCVTCEYCIRFCDDDGSANALRDTLIRGCVRRRGTAGIVASGRGGGGLRRLVVVVMQSTD